MRARVGVAFCCGHAQGISGVVSVEGGVKPRPVHISWRG